MLFHNDRQQIRRMFFEVWNKQKSGQFMQPLEHVILGVILDHPEYQYILDEPDAFTDKDFSPDDGQTNPFFHMGLHIAIREQVASDRPVGIAALWRDLQAGGRAAHDIEHDIQECLAESLWLAQREGRLPDETGYLDCIRRRTGNRQAPNGSQK